MRAKNPLFFCFFRKERFREYIRKYAPEDESFTAVQNTPFFQENLAGYL